MCHKVSTYEPFGAQSKNLELKLDHPLKPSQFMFEKSTILPILCILNFLDDIFRTFSLLNFTQLCRKMRTLEVKSGITSRFHNFYDLQSVLGN